MIRIIFMTKLVFKSRPLHSFKYSKGENSIYFKKNTIVDTTFLNKKKKKKMRSF